MWSFILRRILLMVPTLLVVSLISFVIIEAPPGDYMDSYVNALLQQQEAVDPAEIESLRKRYGLDAPLTYAISGGSATSCRATWAARWSGTSLLAN